VERLKVDIRAMRSGDESMLFFIAEESLHPLALGYGHGERYRPDELVELLARALVYVAEAAGEVAGYVAVERQDDAIAVRCLCVNPAFEARSVAHQLVDWVEGLAFDQRVARLAARVPAGDEPSLRLYRKHEFVARPATDRPETIVLEKRLPTAS